MLPEMVEQASAEQAMPNKTNAIFLIAEYLSC